MINITDKGKCCGCTACESICPKRAIEMVPDEEGFVYPQVDSSICTNCDVCLKICPILSENTTKHFDTQFFIARVKSENVLNSSTSGGFVTPIAEYVFENKGVVCGVAFDNEFVVRHKIYDSCDDNFNADKALAEMRGSKYVQSDLSDIYVLLDRHIKSGRKVLFIGAPCQVAGLKSFLKHDYDNLITIDFVCHGVPSPKLWETYKKYQQGKFKSKFQSVHFRSKYYGYHKSAMKIVFDNNKVYVGSPRVDFMLKSFFKEICSRPSCYKCNFKTIERCSDFTIYDCWRPYDLLENFIDDDLGYTNVIVQSQKAKNILMKISNQYKLYQVKNERAHNFIDEMVVNSAEPHLQREKFYVNMDKASLDVHINNFIPVSNKDRIVEKIKMLLCKLGVIRFFSGKNT